MTQDTLYVGSLEETVFVYGRSGDDWTELARLTAADRREGDFFGMAVAATSDTVVVGAPKREEAGFVSGAAYVFTRDANEWTQSAKLTPSQPADQMSFGIALATSGGRVIVGAQLDPTAAAGAGAAFAYQLGAEGWTEVAALRAADAAENDWFGVAVALAADNAFVAASLKDAVGVNSGAVYSFDW